MKTLVLVLAVALTVFIVGCSGEKKEEKPLAVVPSAEEYRTILEKRVSSSDGCDIDIRKEVSEFERSSDDEKRKMYNKQEELAR